jgi:hypothetical protein
VPQGTDARQPTAKAHPRTSATIGHTTRSEAHPRASATRAIGRTTRSEAHPRTSATAIGQPTGAMASPWTSDPSGGFISITEGATMRIKP